MEVRIDPDDKAPPFEQIKAAIIRLVAENDLAPGFRLPPIRQLAGDLGVAPNTVARAYRELEVDGFVRSRGRRGTTVIGTPETGAATAQRAAIDDAVAAARRDGLDGPTILGLVVRAIARS